MEKITFVCTGNTCRSPMAEYILKFKLKENGITDIRVGSAGLAAEEGAKISKNSAAALKSMGIKNYYSFKAKNLTAKIIKNSALVVCMTEGHKRAISGFKNVYTLAEITGVGEIEDPYGQNLKTYIGTAEKISRACDIMVKEILKAKGEKK